MSGAAPRLLFHLTTPFTLLRHHKFILLSPSFSHLHRLSFSHSSPSPLKLKPSQHHHHFQTHASSLTSEPFYSDSSPFLHPWSEWSAFLRHITATASANQTATEDAFAAHFQLSRSFLSEATACLAFARQRPNLLRLLSMRDIAVVVEHGTPFLFRDSDESVRKMKSFVSKSDATVLDTDRANLVDLMKFMLSYASNPLVSSERSNLYNRDLVESSVRNLFGELFKLSHSAPGPNSSDVVQNQMPSRFGQTMPTGPKIEMKRGDWICTRCNFMNFARNVKCLECEEARPKRQLAGGEWECPQCVFYNYGRNVTCLRCDCKRPGQISFGATNSVSHTGYGNGYNNNTSDVDSRLAANEEKAQRWFSKVSQLDSNADINNVIADEDFPEIMPLRKGVNRFVVSTRKTSLERRLANAQYRRNLGNGGTPGVEDFKAGESTKSNDNVDDILGRSAGISHNTSIGDASTVPPVTLSADTLAEKSENIITEERKRVVLDTGVGYAGSSGSSQLSNNSTSQNVIKDKEKEQAEKSERWFKKVAELHDVSDLTSAISDEDFPEIMPMRKGENRFVVSKKKDRSLTSPAYKRRLAMEQAGNTNFVPFVPFPPNYFGKKETQQADGTDSANRSNVESSSISEVAEKPLEMSDDARAGPGFPSADYAQGMTNTESSSRVPGNNPKMLDDSKPGLERRESVKEIGNQYINMKSSNPKPSEQSSSNNNVGSVYGATTSGNSNSSQSFIQEDYSNKYSRNENNDHKPKLTGNSSPSYENQSVRAQWTGKSLEGSAVKEPDPLDMSEEAKAERWFRRVAQIKDISELSQIPDEDFPSIMPMRKGVNRFVVSKRKTPLERRLTSQQYRRNLPVVSSEPVKNENNEGS
ncbi:hypothetical protein Lal_00030377 [Lupinus albus]|uniref:Putative Zinc finger, RanBP2-type n=1 Tax=Lupinus albus TaxID=3870 RepID=A0A6A5N7H1_LUPAL|nr:putative Zinc finger, RanBP2-type [Lupinus albus]KAF1883271.1 hypothetical protein Lal_00030377 [Lupinus albus]